MAQLGRAFVSWAVWPWTRLSQFWVRLPPGANLVYFMNMCVILFAVQLCLFLIRSLGDKFPKSALVRPFVFCDSAVGDWVKYSRGAVKWGFPFWHKRSFIVRQRSLTTYTNNSLFRAGASSPWRHRESGRSSSTDGSQRDHPPGDSSSSQREDWCPLVGYHRRSTAKANTIHLPSQEGRIERRGIRGKKALRRPSVPSYTKENLKVLSTHTAQWV